PPGLPADLLRSRADVAEAEQNLAAACAQIGVAMADFFPTVKLTGSAGFESIDIGHTLDWKDRIWSIGPGLTLPIFEGGKLKANLEQAQAKYDEQQAVYRESVLSAFRDVEDTLTDIHLRADELAAQEKAVDSSRKYLELAQRQYEIGLASY